eukprot:NODE_6116_length_604_cov_14.198198_g5710_i0.p2 GENE.NODE_6116_length_604_cov_14.198198_g5710_i0~~NODE_6116_length_604_cov_14.198198_g5710_i0.p2  ORF type:complete len:159 (-),score=17.65 NODE_6116_length_604_cov_14.198198_g5710_i0:127-546(-)
MPMHFPSKGARATGTFEDRLSSSSRCIALDSAWSAESTGDWKGRFIRRLTRQAGVPLVELVDLLLPRWDAHLEMRRKFTSAGPAPLKLDCTHWCMRGSLWDPILGRMVQSLFPESFAPQLLSATPPRLVPRRGSAWKRQ